MMYENILKAWKIYKNIKGNWKNTNVQVSLNTKSDNIRVILFYGDHYGHKSMLSWLNRLDKKDNKKNIWYIMSLSMMWKVKCWRSGSTSIKTGGSRYSV